MTRHWLSAFAAVLCACSITDPIGDGGWLGMSTASPIPGAFAIEPPASYASDYQTARVCIVENGGTIRRNAPTFDELHWYATADSVFYTAPVWPYDYGYGPFIGYAHARSITLSSRGRAMPGAVQHEIAHLASGELTHEAPFWTACGWQFGGYEARR